jgi:hypothetical protein
MALVVLFRSLHHARCAHASVWLTIPDHLTWMPLRFLLPESETIAGLSLTLVRSLTVDVGPCASGVDVLRKVLEEFCVREAAGENSIDNRGTVTVTEIGGLTVDGWAYFSSSSGRGRVNRSARRRCFPCATRCRTIPYESMG